MSIDSRYKEQVDLFCEATYKVGSEEMLEMAKNNSEKRTGAKNIRFAKKALIIAAAAAVFAAGTTVAAGAMGVGPLSGLFTQYFGDSATQKLADEGYIYTADNYAQDNVSEDNGTYPVMGEAFTKDIFTAKVLGLAGDTQAPMMLFDITVNDPEIAAASDTIGVYTLGLGTDEFESSRELYGLEYGRGVKDDDDPTLFHVSTRVPPAWVTGGKEVVFDIVSIHTAGESESDSFAYLYGTELDDLGLALEEAEQAFGMRKEYNVDMQFRFTLPENVLKESVEKDYDELAFDVNGRTYRLHYAQFGAHFTIVRFDYDDANYDYTVNPDADMKAAEKFTLTVDGVTYTPDLSQTGSFVDDQGNCNLGIKGMCYMALTFDAVDYENAQSITLEANGVSYEIK